MLKSIMNIATTETINTIILNVIDDTNTSTYTYEVNGVPSQLDVIEMLKEHDLSVIDTYDIEVKDETIILSILKDNTVEDIEVSSEELNLNNEGVVNMSKPSRIILDDLTVFSQALEDHLCPNTGMKAFTEQVTEIDTPESDHHTIMTLSNKLIKALDDVLKLEIENYDMTKTIEELLKENIKLTESLDKAKDYYAKVNPIIKQLKQKQALVNLDSEIKPKTITATPVKVKTTKVSTQKCCKCNKTITDAAVNYSKTRPEFEGKSLCYRCQQKTRKSIHAEIATLV